jgi:ribonuclease HI
MYFDGSLKLGGAGAGVLFISPEGKQLKYVLQILWQATNNEAEYEALIHGLRIVTSLRIKQLLVYGDSAWSSIKSTKTGTIPKTTWMPIVLKYEN